MAVKSIVIGMGSFGHDVCEVLARRLEADYGSLDRMPWVKIICYETEQQNNSLLAHRGLVKHMGISPHEWNSYMTEPAKYDRSLDFQKWADESLRATMRAGGVPVHGASNTRSTGRLCFLHQQNLTDFDEAFRSLYATLQGLTPAKAAKVMGRNDSDPPIIFGRIGANESRMIRVYLVGSLAGGTNSGSFIDIACYLQTLNAIGNALELVGMLVIPHESYNDSAHWGNTFAGLTELNHFISGKIYKAKFPNSDEPVVTAIAPFSSVYLVQSKSGTANTTDSLGPVRHSLAELIHLTTVEDPEEKVENKVVDGLAKIGTARDYDGRSLNYASVGASVVVFPVDHMIEGLSAKLACEALQPLLEQRSPGEAEVTDVFRQLKGDSESYNQRMLSHPIVERYLQLLGEETQKAAVAALKGDTTALPSIRKRIEAGIATVSQETNQNFQGEFRNPIYEVSKNIALERMNLLDKLVRDMICSESKGVFWAKTILDGIIDKGNNRLKALENPSTDIGIRAEAVSSIERAKQFEQELYAKKGCSPFARTKASSMINNHLTNQLNNYWRATFLIRSEEFEKEVVKQLVIRADVLRARLIDPENGFIQFAEGLLKDLKAEYTLRNERGPEVNGLSLFEPERTLIEEWARYASNEKLPGFRARVRGSLDAWFDDLTAENARSSFDRPKKHGWREVERLMMNARFPFEDGLRQERVEQRLVAWPNWRAELDHVAKLGKAFINVDPARNPFGIPGSPDQTRRPAYIYFHAKDNAANEAASDVLEHLATLNGGNICVLPGDKYRIIFTEALVGFAPYSIYGVKEAEQHYTEGRRARSDIAWLKLSGEPLNKQERYQVGLILLALAFGLIKQDRGILSFKMAPTPFDPGGRYDLGDTLDLSDASYHLGRNELAVSDLRRQVEGYIQHFGLEDAAIKIGQFNASVEGHKFMIGGMSVNNRQAFIRELDAMRTIDGLLESLKELYNTFDWNGGNWEEREAKDFSPASFVCNLCEQMLLPKAGHQAPDDLPEFCPNSQCGQRIRYDTLIK